VAYSIQQAVTIIMPFGNLKPPLAMALSILVMLFIIFVCQHQLIEQQSLSLAVAQVQCNATYKLYDDHN
jgi:cell division protein FtsB